VINSILSPGVYVHSGAIIRESIILTDTVIEKNAIIERTILDKRVRIQENARIGEVNPQSLRIAMVGKNAIVPPNMIIEAGGIVGTDLIPSDYPSQCVHTGDYLTTRRQPYEL
jgi:glucose-1-phosphate adenylyltransferase